MNFIKNIDLKNIKTKLLELIGFDSDKVKRILVIDFTKYSTVAVYLEIISDEIKILDYSIKDLTKVNEKLKISEDFIKDFISKNNVIEKDVILNIVNDESLVIKNISLPVLPDKEIIGAVKWQMKDDISFDFDNAIIEWSITKEFHDDSGAKRRQITFAIAKRALLDQYLSIITRCYLEPIYICTNSFNYSNIIKYYSEEAAVLALLDMEYGDATLNIYVNKKLTFIRKLPVSWRKIVSSLTETLVSDKGEICLSFEEAEKIVEKFGIPIEASFSIKDNVQSAHVLSLMRPHLETLARELKLSFDYFTSKYNEKSPLTIYLTDYAANLKNLNKYLRKELVLNVSNLTLPKNVNCKDLKDAKLAEEGLNKIMGSIGSVLSKSKEIDLLPIEIKTKKSEYLQKASLRLLSIVVVSIFLFSLFITKFQIRDYNNRIKNAKIHLNTLESVRMLQQKILIREKFIDNTKENKIPVDGLLKEISVIIPNEIVLNNLTLNQSRRVLMLKGTIVNGKAVDSPLTNFMEELEKSDFFSEASLISSRSMADGISFEIKCDIVNK